MSRPAAPKKGVAMCCVTVGYRAYLLPVNKGMELVKLMIKPDGAQLLIGMD